MFEKFLKDFEAHFKTFWDTYWEAN